MLSGIWSWSMRVALPFLTITAQGAMFPCKNTCLGFRRTRNLSGQWRASVGGLISGVRGIWTIWKKRLWSVILSCKRRSNGGRTWPMSTNTVKTLRWFHCYESGSRTLPTPAGGYSTNGGKKCVRSSVESKRSSTSSGSCPGPPSMMRMTVSSHRQSMRCLRRRSVS